MPNVKVVAENSDKNHRIITYLQGELEARL